MANKHKRIEPLRSFIVKGQRLVYSRVDGEHYADATVKISARNAKHASDLADIDIVISAHAVGEAHKVTYFDNIDD